MYIKILTVTALNNYIKKVVDNDFILNNANIKGEISNLKLHSSGHIYFSLKDDSGRINCIMFKNNAVNLKFTPENGMNVVVAGKVSVYVKDGAYQLYCNEMKLDGVGELFVAFEKMKNKLQVAGMFEDEHKKAIPKFPRRIGVITSPTGAAVRDIINVSTRRNENVNILIYPALVQGINASKDIIKGIEKFNKIEDVDVIILARGGGSLEELWAFNEEALAYAVFNSKKPIITGVGHETDFTIVDFVSDRRAPTPSAAAEIAVESLEDINYKIKGKKELLNSGINYLINVKYKQIDILKKSIEVNNPRIKIVNEYNRIDTIQKNLYSKIVNKTALEKEKLTNMNSLLEAHNPLNVLKKGYSIIQDENNKIIKDVKTLKNSNRVKIILKDGKITASIKVE